MIEGDGYFTLPNGLFIQYPHLRREYDPDTAGYQTCYASKNSDTMKIYGAKAVENITQGLARIVITDVMLRVFNQTGYHPALTTYDSLDYVVPANETEAFDESLGTRIRCVSRVGAGLALGQRRWMGENLVRMLSRRAMTERWLPIKGYKL